MTEPHRPLKLLTLSAAQIGVGEERRAPNLSGKQRLAAAHAAMLRALYEHNDIDELDDITDLVTDHGVDLPLLAEQVAAMTYAFFALWDAASALVLTHKGQHLDLIVADIIAERLADRIVAGYGASGSIADIIAARVASAEQ